MTDSTQPDPSPTERRIRRLVVPEPSGFRPEQRIDWIHNVDVEQWLSDHPERRSGGH